MLSCTWFIEWAGKGRCNSWALSWIGGSKSQGHTFLGLYDCLDPLPPTSSPTVLSDYLLYSLSIAAKLVTTSLEASDNIHLTYIYFCRPKNPGRPVWALCLGSLVPHKSAYHPASLTRPTTVSHPTEMRLGWRLCVLTFGEECNS